MNEIVKDFIDSIVKILDHTLFSVGGNPFNLGTLFFIFFSSILLFYGSYIIKRYLTKRFVKSNIVEQGITEPVINFARYIMILIGIIVILQTAGINLSTLSFLVGALGIGIGFGLQNITSNFISGLIILFEKPIKLGDRVELENITGNIIKISSRSTTIQTNDNIHVIVPNSAFIDSKVINWSHNDSQVRFNFPVGVSYNEDPEKIKQLLLEVAEENPGVLKTPKPDVLFQEFNDSSLDFILRIWTVEYTNTPLVLKSQLYYSIFEKFKVHHVEIPFPQRDIHIKSGLKEFWEKLKE
jgi:small-conductance mechanosensitive channel